MSLYSPFPKVPFLASRTRCSIVFKFMTAFFCSPWGATSLETNCATEKAASCFLGNVQRTKATAKIASKAVSNSSKNSIAIRDCLQDFFVYQLNIDDTVIRCCYSKNLAKKVLSLINCFVVGVCKCFARGVMKVTITIFVPVAFWRFYDLSLCLFLASEVARSSWEFSHHKYKYTHPM